MPARKIWKSGPAVKALVELGLSELEASAYCYLVEAGASTGYQVAKELGKAVANTYKALYSLEEKGAVLIEDGESRRCRAVAPKELLARLDGEFRARREAAREQLARTREAPDDPGVYRLATRPQVMERAFAMLRGATGHVVVDAFPEPLAELAPALAEVVGRGVRLLIQCYEPVEIAGVAGVVHPSHGLVLDLWPGNRLSVSVDGAEYMHAILERDGDGDGVRQAVWSASTLLACASYVAGVDSVCLSSLMAAIDAGAGTAELERILQGFDPHRLRATRGFQRLTGRSGLE